MAFLAAEKENRQTEDLPQVDFCRVPQGILLSVRKKINKWKFCLLKITPIRCCFYSDSTPFFILSLNANALHCLYSETVDPFTDFSRQLRAIIVFR